MQEPENIPPRDLATSIHLASAAAGTMQDTVGQIGAQFRSAIVAAAINHNDFGVRNDRSNSFQKSTDQG